MNLVSYCLLSAALAAVLLLTVYSSTPRPAGRDPIDSKEVKCLVCRATMNEMELAMSKLDSKKKMDVVVDLLHGTTSRAQSAAKYLTELEESVCERIEEYAKARYKTDGKMVLLKPLSKFGTGSEKPEVNFVQEGNLNITLKRLCLELVEDHKESIVKMFQQKEAGKNTGARLCSEVANICDGFPLEDDYEFTEGSFDIKTDGVGTPDGEDIKHKDLDSN
ncbi:protein seele-like [Sabethes cyaneus]|uniref:protein seele-like n=1 Tax=Sabethes cyaneus TaxID=53552 RepID=UPI00237EAC89|nr:protein seele-like [Sabethes cyaneus]